MATPDRLAPPPMPANPTQADQGAQVYYLTCMACHGDQGQGLTDEWRAVWGPEEQNCWQSKCHAANHPPEGFDLPQYAPPVIGAGALARFETAGDLNTFICERMPWQAPGTLDTASCWQLTAYLLRANGIASDPVSLNIRTAARIQISRKPEAGVQSDQSGAVRGGSVIALGAGLMLLLLITRRRGWGRGFRQK